MKKYLLVIMVLIFAIGVSQVLYADTDNQTYTAAILPFKARGAGLKNYEGKIADALFAKLAVHPEIDLVDREALDSVLTEHQLNLSGMVNTRQATQIGQLTGAKILITGAISEFDNHIIVIAKLIGTETSKVVGDSARGKTSDDLLVLVDTLADKIVQLIQKRSGELVAKAVEEADPIDLINKKLKGRTLPSLNISIVEHHVGARTIDPAAETELQMICQKAGFRVFDNKIGGSRQSDIIIKGEGFSEFAGRRGELITVKARVELKAIDSTTGEIIATDRETSVFVDLSEQIAGKKALEKAASLLAIRMLPRLADSYGRTSGQKQ